MESAHLEEAMQFSDALVAIVSLGILIFFLPAEYVGGGANLTGQPWKDPFWVQGSKLVKGLRAFLMLATIASYAGYRFGKGKSDIPTIVGLLSLAFLALTFVNTSPAEQSSKNVSTN